MSGISIGTQLHAPDGYRNLEKDVIYYFLRSSTTTGRVLLIEYEIRPMKEVHHKSAKRPTRRITPLPLTKLICLPRSEFEDGVRDTKIVKNETQKALPPWLEELEGLNLAAIDSLRKNPKISHSERIDAKLAAIEPLVLSAGEILDSDNPDCLINKHARSQEPKLNETRVRLWFYTYILFGRNRFALHYPVNRLGHWDRMTCTSTTKRGRPCWQGKGHGYNTSPSMLAKMYKGYRRECGVGIEMDVIYRNCMVTDFGCRSRKVKSGKTEYTEIWHPKGEEFPKPGTFAYHIRKKFGSDIVATTLLGRVRARSKILPTRGPFTEHTLNLMQRLLADAYAVKELARGLVDGNPLPPLYVVTKRDTASGLKTGIGFSQGSETSSSYDMADFCEAVDKVRFCRLFGFTIRPAQWPNRVAAPSAITDRGPGSTRGARASNEGFAPVVVGMAPSRSPQSDAVIESSHPKHRHNDDAPSFMQSNLRTFELIRREIFALLEFNASSSVRNRIPMDIVNDLPNDTPIALWDALDSRGRNDGVMMSFDDAVRTFLGMLDALLTSDGVVLHGQLFKSPALDASSACKSVVGRPGRPIKVYFLEGCIRHIWMDWNGELIELDLTSPVPVGNEVLNMSLAELIEFEKFCKARVPKHAENRRGVAVEIYTEFLELTGRTMDSGRRVAGRPKRGTRAARQEAAEARAAVKGRRVA